MNKITVGQLKEWLGKYVAIEVPPGPANGDLFDQGYNDGQVALAKYILSKVYQIEDKAGLYIKCKECADNVTCKAYLNRGGFHSDGGVRAHFHPSPKPTVNDKPKTYEEWRSTLSPEEQDESDRELARLVREHESDKPTESLAELADRKGMKINISRSKKEWSIGIRHKGTGTDKKGPIIAYHSMLYEGIEIYARAYLETLEDKKS